MADSASSSPASFYTANDSASRPSMASSPAQAAPCPYREACQLPRELKEHCQIFLEEQLYTCAINLVNSALGAGASRSAAAATPRPVAVPPPSHLALLGTLVVHPLHTTRADRLDHVTVSALALEYLRSLVAAVGPVGAGLRAAFTFCPSRAWARRPGDSDASDVASDADSDRDVDGLRGRLANEASLWTRGQDLWSVVGWAFNTAALHPHRWRYWRAWLDLMLDVLDADWAERQRLDLEAHDARARAGPEPTAFRRDSMIVMYMDQRDDRHAGLKRVVKALLADGGSLSSSAFPEVFDREPRRPRKASRKRKREQVLDVDKGKFGDYLDDSISSGVSEPQTLQKARDAPKNASFACSSPGLAGSVALRLRFYRLLSAATFALRRRSELNQLYEDFAAAVKVLPLPMFSLVVSQRENALLPATHVTLLKQLFHLLLPSRCKDPRSVDPDGDAQGSLTMPMLENCYMALPANTVGLDDNAKLSLVVESAIQLLWICDMVEYTDSFADAALRGVGAREAEAKAKKRTGKMRADPGDALAQDVLAGSAERIRVLLEALEASTGAAD